MNIFNIDFINNVFVNSAKEVSNYSSFLANALLDNWNSLNKASLKRSVKKTKDALLKNLERLDDLEKKKDVDLKAIIKSDISLIRLIQVNVDKEYADNLIKRIRKVNSLKELFLVLLDRFESTVVREPKKKVKKHNVKYAIDDQGYIYANLVYKNDMLVFDRNSFNNEMYRFNNSIENDEELDLEIPEKYGNKISPGERKRRIYINSMFKLNKSIFKIMNKDLNILYPIDKFYKYASVIVANMYKELFEYNKNDLVLNKLWQETIKNYGSRKSLSLYEDAYWNFIKKYKSLNKEVAKEYKEVVASAKEKKDNVLFCKSKNPIPSVEDIDAALANIVIQKVETNLDYYLVDFKNRINDSIEYMSVKDMINFYRTFKSVLNKNSKLVKYYPILQKCIAKEISLRNGKDIEICVKRYLKEDVLF